MCQDLRSSVRRGSEWRREWVSKVKMGGEGEFFTCWIRPPLYINFWHSNFPEFSQYILLPLIVVLFWMPSKIMPALSVLILVSLAWFRWLFRVFLVCGKQVIHLPWEFTDDYFMPLEGKRHYIWEYMLIVELLDLSIWSATPRTINPLTPVSPGTVCKEHWPMFHFWRQHLWLKLASRILKFCRRERPQSHRVIIERVWNMCENASKFEWTTSSNISL